MFETTCFNGSEKPEDIIRDPYVLEFLGLNPNDDFYESDLEQALITHLQKFLLELGRGFSFIGRQKRLTLDGRHFRINLVFYNYILKCFVLIDLKIGELFFVLIKASRSLNILCLKMNHKYLRLSINYIYQVKKNC